MTLSHDDSTININLYYYYYYYYYIFLQISVVVGVAHFAECHPWSGLSLTSIICGPFCLIVSTVLICGWCHIWRMSDDLKHPGKERKREKAKKEDKVWKQRAKEQKKREKRQKKMAPRL